MRILFLIIVVIHALIHLLGFVKGMEIKEVKELSMPISKPMALLWLSTTLLLVVYAFMYHYGFQYSWLVGFIAIFLSQLLIFSSWKDAKFGSIANLVILIITFTDLGGYLIKSRFTNEVKATFSKNSLVFEEILTEKDIEHLPLIIQKYLRYTQSVGQPKIKNFRATFMGGMRGKPEEKYMQFNSVQYNFYNEPSRYFYMEATKMGLPASGLHVYKNKTATFKVKLLNWFTVVDAKGDKLNQAETVTLFNDMCCIAPATLIDKNILWQTINDTTVKGIYKNGNISISATLYFNSEGALQNFISNDRYETNGKEYHNYPWATPLENYKLINGYLLPTKAKLIYEKPEGDFTYGELEYKSVQYNVLQYLD